MTPRLAHRPPVAALTAVFALAALAFLLGYVRVTLGGVGAGKGRDEMNKVGASVRAQALHRVSSARTYTMPHAAST